MGTDRVAGPRPSSPDGEAGGHVEFDLVVGQDVLPEQRGESASVLRGEQLGPVVFGEDVLEHEGVHVDEGGLQDAQAEHGHLLLILAVGGDLAALAE